MKTLIAVLLVVLAGAIGAQTVATAYSALWIGVTDTTDSKGYDISKARADMRQGCIKSHATCNLIVVEHDGRRLATMDLDGNWAEYASKQEIADVLAAALQRSNTPMPAKKDPDGVLFTDIQ